MREEEEEDKDLFQIDHISPCVHDPEGRSESLQTASCHSALPVGRNKGSDTCLRTSGVQGGMTSDAEDKGEVEEDLRGDESAQSKVASGGATLSEWDITLFEMIELNQRQSWKLRLRPRRRTEKLPPEKWPETISAEEEKRLFCLAEIMSPRSPVRLHPS